MSLQENESKCEILTRKTNEDKDEKKYYEMQSIQTQQSILQLEEAAEKMQISVDKLKPFEVIKFNLIIICKRVSVRIIIFCAYKFTILFYNRCAEYT